MFDWWWGFLFPTMAVYLVSCVERLVPYTRYLVVVVLLSCLILPFLFFFVEVTIVRDPNK